LARDCHFKGFPEFDDFYFKDFSSSTQFTLSLLTLPLVYAPTKFSKEHAQSNGNCGSRQERKMKKPNRQLAAITFSFASY